jgi:hypothetical protein
MQKWEYSKLYWGSDGLWLNGSKISNDYQDHRAYFHTLGEDGWELVSVVSEGVANGGSLNTIYSGFVAFFKRPKNS